MGTTPSLSGLCTMRMGHKQITIWKGAPTRCCTRKKEKRLKTRVDEMVVEETGVDKLGVIIQPIQVQMTFSV